MTCGAKKRQDRPACNAPGCKGRHIRKLHEFLKDMYEEENQVHLVQGDGEWEEPEGTWAMDEAEEEEMMIVNTVQQAESSWLEIDDLWLELNRGIYCVRACHGENGQVPRIEVGQSCETLYLPEEEGAVEAGWWSPDPTELNLARGNRNTSSISSWAAPERVKAELSRFEYRRPQARRATRLGERQQQDREPGLRQKFGKASQPWAKGPGRQRPGGKRQATREPPEGRTRPAPDRARRERTQGSDEGREGRTRAERVG